MRAVPPRAALFCLHIFMHKYDVTERQTIKPMRYSVSAVTVDFMLDKIAKIIL